MNNTAHHPSYQIYQVGGAVRDRLLGLPVEDIDWVVVGALPEQMIADGFKPVGKDFPVFLHPSSHQEYALARSERKVGAGYHGFEFISDPSITLEEDLQRRDFTINALAQTADGQIIDVTNGKTDLAARVFRHISAAFTEDPVRILRLGRFLARFTDFNVAPETFALCQKMVASGEVDALVSERIWQEFSRGLLAAQPSRMLRFFADCQALEKILPELWQQPIAIQQQVFQNSDSAAATQTTLAQRFAVIVVSANLNDVDLRAMKTRLRLPNDVFTAASVALTAKRQPVAELTNASSQLQLFEHIDALRRPERLAELLPVMQLLALWPESLSERLQQALLAVNTVNGGAIAAACNNHNAIAEAIRSARLAAIKAIQHGA